LRKLRSFQIACGLIAAHVVVSEVLTLEPGTSVSDRLPALFVPLLILAAAGFTYPRVRPGFAATIALTLAALALTGGALAMASIEPEGFDAYSVSGIGALAAGLLLAWLGSAGLWESRKAQGRPVVRRLLITVASAVFAFEVLLPVGFALVATHRPASPPEGDGIDRPFEEVTITTADGLELEAWNLPSRNGAAVIVYPDRAQSVPHVNMLADNGFGVLALDMRGYGSSEGNPNAFGWGATADIDAAAGFLRGQPDVVEGRVGGLGLSVGGEQMIEAAAVNPALRAVVSEGAGERSVRETLIFGPRAALVVPQQAVLTTAVAVFSGDGPPVALDEAAAGIAPSPVFFIHGEEGQAGEELNEDFYSAAGEPKQIWKVPGAGHVDGLEAAPEEYERHVVDFFEVALDVGSQSTP